jgi:hypothetical protein
MLIHLVGFEWRLPGVIPLPDFCKHLQSKQGKQVKFAVHPRVHFTGRLPGRFVGVFLTIKDQKKVTSIDVKSYRIAVQKLKEGTQLVDFNFFMVSEQSGKGLYSYYHNSCGVSVFNDFVTRQYRELRESRRKKEIAALGRRAEKGQKEAVNKKYEQEMGTGQMIRREELPTLLAKLAKIKTFEFEATSLFADSPWFRPLAEQVQSRKVRLRFKPKLQVGTLADRIVDLVSGQRIRQGKIEGEDADKVRQVINVIDTPDSFGHYPFDNVVEDGMIDYSRVENSPFLTTMGKVMDDHSIHFEKHR